VKRKLLFFCVVIVSVVGIMLVGCAKAPTPAAPTPAAPAEEATVIPWGTASCLSGPYAAWGMEEHQIQEIQVDDINSGGGCWGGVLGHEPGFRVQGKLYKWNLVAYDAKMDPVEGAKVVNRLISQDGCKFIHIFMDQVYLATRGTLNANKVLVTVQGIDPADINVTPPENPRTFRFLLSIPEVNGLVYAPWMVDTLGIKTVAALGESVLHSTGFWTTYEQVFNSKGVKVTGEQWYEGGTTDYTAPLAKLIAGNPDMIFLPQPPSEQAGLIVKQARQKGYKGILFEGVCPATKTLVDLAGWDNLEGFYSVNAVSAPFPYPQQQWFYDEYTKKHGVDAWSGGLFDRFDFIYNLTLAIEKADSLDTDAVAKALEQMTPEELFSGFGPGAYMGGKSIYGQNHILIPRHWISQIKGGKEINVMQIPPPPGI
jgi:branched-chain amino acid transport system substrate-binding protein